MSKPYDMKDLSALANASQTKTAQEVRELLSDMINLFIECCPVVDALRDRGAISEGSHKAFDVVGKAILTEATCFLTETPLEETAKTLLTEAANYRNNHE